MIGRLNHVAIAVPDLDAACATYRGALGANVSAPEDLPEHGVTVVFVELPEIGLAIEKDDTRRSHLAFSRPRLFFRPTGRPADGGTPASGAWPGGRTMNWRSSLPTTVLSRSFTTTAPLLSSFGRMPCSAPRSFATMAAHLCFVNKS